MEFVRPEIRIWIWRWREALIGLAVLLLGFYWALKGLGIMAIVGFLLVLAGTLLIGAGIQRARFRIGSGGTGVVQVDEGQVTYYGPIDGGSVAVADLTLVELAPSQKSQPDWILHSPGAAPLRVPTNAEGAEALFDVFAALDGIQTERMLSQLNSAADRQVVVWQAKIVTLH